MSAYSGGGAGMCSRSHRQEGPRTSGCVSPLAAGKPNPAVSSIPLGMPSVWARLLWNPGGVAHPVSLSPSVSFQVRGSCEWQPGGGHPGLAIPVGHCHRLFLLYLWGWTPEPHRGPSPAPGHLPGWHSALLAGQYGRAAPHNRPVIWAPDQQTRNQGHHQPWVSS